MSARYQRVAIAGWGACSAAGDAAATWQAASTGRRHVERSAAGWLGRVDDPAPDDTRLLALAARAAAPAWRAIAALPGLPAWSASSSKGDPLALAAALAGDAAAFGAALPGALDHALARRLGVRRTVPAPLAAACATGLYGLLAVADRIEHAGATHGLAGAAEASLTPLVLAGFRNLGALADADGQDGFIPAEGAGFLALAARGAWRLTAGVRLGEAAHETRSGDPAVLRHALGLLWDAAGAPDLIVMHATGTAAGAATEDGALDAGPWRAAPRLAMKPAIGHCLGASGAVELAAALHAPAARLWKIALGFGGHLCAVAVERA